MFWFLFFLAIFLWAFGIKGTVKIALITGICWFGLLSLLVIFS
tara:strand:+ start:77 stop:205 length:129 start_codon:yes stop_codon:yes gene_type:complete